MPKGPFLFDDIHLKSSGVILHLKIDDEAPFKGKADRFILSPERPEDRGKTFIKVCRKLKLPERYGWWGIVNEAEEAIMIYDGTAHLIAPNIISAIRDGWDGQSFWSLRDDLLRWALADFFRSFAEASGIEAFWRFGGEVIDYRPHCFGEG